MLVFFFHYVYSLIKCTNSSLRRSRSLLSMVLGKQARINWSNGSNNESIESTHNENSSSDQLKYGFYRCRNELSLCDFQGQKSP